MISSELGFMHPEWVAGRRLWIDPVMQDIIDKIRFGDPVRGWEGDDQLAVFYNQPQRRWELMRWENGDYSMVARSKPDTVFDERIIDELAKRDVKRNPNRDLHTEVVEHNEKILQGHHDHFNEMIAEEIAPRMRRSFQKEGWI